MEQLQNCSSYQPLNLGANEIRLFEILPGNLDEPIVGRFAVAILGHELKYDALSYTWSDPSITATIQIRGSEPSESNFDFLVPAGLVTTLQDLRHLNLARFFWIDAICINQAALEERNHQVRLMRSIYATASNVRIWLDLEINLGDPALSRLDSLNGNSTVDDILSAEGFWTSINEILDHRYWQRMWVQQEMSTATRLTIHCRKVQTPVLSLVHYQRLVYERLLLQDTSSIENTEAGMNHCLHRALEFWPYGESTPEQRYNNPFFGIHEYFLIFDALETSRIFHSTDPRDKVFALAEAVRFWERHTMPLVIDYNLSTREVYTQVAKNIVQEWGSLDFISESILGDAKPKHNLPSWLPDYSRPRSTGSFHQEKGNTAVDCKYFTEPKFLDNDRILQVQGSMTDKILIPYRQLSFQNILHNLPAQEVFRVFNDLVETALQLRASAGLGNLSPIGTTRDLMLLEQQMTLLIILIGPLQHLKRDSVEYLTEFDEQLKLFSFAASEGLQLTWSYSQLLRIRDNQFCATPSEIEWQILTRLRGRVFYLSQKGVMGIAPTSLLPGDEIWNIYGCRSPVVLRPRHDKYTAIGPAYHQSLCIHSKIFDGFDQEGLVAERRGQPDPLAGLSWVNKHGKFQVEKILLC